MATTKYLLQDLQGETIDTKSKKQAAIKVATDNGLVAYRVVTDKGSVVHEVIPEITETPADLETVEEPTVAEPAAEPEQDENETVEEVLYYEQMDFPGNYSIVTAPGAVEIAAAAGVPAKVENHGASLTRTVHFGGTDMDLAQKVVEVVREETAAALAHLKAWQKENLERRRGLTDMQRYLEHRAVIAEHYTKVAKTIKKNGLA